MSHHLHPYGVEGLHHPRPEAHLAQDVDGGLRELEAAGLLTRTVRPVVPPHVDYAITDLGRSAVPAIDTLRQWGMRYRTSRERRR